MQTVYRLRRRLLASRCDGRSFCPKPDVWSPDCEVSPSPHPRCFSRDAHDGIRPRKGTKRHVPATYLSVALRIRLPDVGRSVMKHCQFLVTLFCFIKYFYDVFCQYHRFAWT